MGNKTKAGLITVLFVLLFVTPVQASSIEELYALYQIDYVNAYPDGIVKTMRSYQSAQKYVKRYRGVIESDFDSSIYTRRLEKYEAELKNIESMLLDGYDLSLSEIYSLEDKYSSIQSKIKSTQESMAVSENSIEKLDSSDVPTYTEYCEAVSRKAELDSNSPIGDLSKLKVPIKSSFLLDKHNKTSATYMTTDNAPIVALFSGKVVETSDTYCKIENSYGVAVYYRNLSDMSYSIGDVVDEGAVIGHSYSYVTLQLSLDNNFVDITKLFEKE